MQISCIYSNQPRLFTPIRFHCRDDSDHLNVVYGEVRHPRDQKRDSHNLGKTTLLHLTDFLLLKGMSPDQFLAKHLDRFAEFVFFIEVALNAGDYATIRRSAAAPNRIAMTRHPEGGQDLLEAPEDVWDHPDLSRDDAVKLLDAWADLNSNNFDYSIGLSLPGQAGIPSSQSEGASYKKLICALFDLALLNVYEDAPFFHFVYHDGILEGLDDRKKFALLAVVREQVATRKTQYILTVIDSDIPRDAAGERIEFPEEEIVLRLHDEGSEGRLFKMTEF